MELKTEIFIPATPAEVWLVLSDTEQYPDWNPLVSRLEGQLQAGAVVSAQLPTMRFRPTILVAEPEKELRWIGKLFFTGLFDGEHYFILEARDGGTLFRHGEHFTGLLVPLYRRKLNGDIKKWFYAMNEALRDEVARRSGSKG